MFRVLVPTVSPQSLALPVVGLDPEMPKDLRQFHELDGLYAALRSFNMF